MQARITHVNTRQGNICAALATARHLLGTANVSDGFTALWERGRLDLSVEAVVLEQRFTALFTDEEREAARARLEEYGYSPRIPNATEVEMRTRLIEVHDYNARHHSGGTHAAKAMCSWHGTSCNDKVVASALTRNRGGDTWHAVCQRALDQLRAT